MPSRLSSIGGMEARGTEEIGTHRQYLFYYALRRLRDRNLAEDAVQDTFLAALANQASFAGKSTRKTWLTGILNHKVCDQLRKSSQSHALLESLSLANGKEIDLPVSASMGRHCLDPRMELEFKELGMALMEALQKLPPRMAMVYELHEFEGWNGREICQAFRISQPNLWIILHRARKCLRESLSSWRSGDGGPRESNG